MAPIRIRHPKGISTIDVLLDDDKFTVQDLQQEIRNISDVLPSQQDLKSGYPPRSLTIIPELPISSLGLKSGDQLILATKAGASTVSSQSQSANVASNRSVASGARLPSAAVPESSRTSNNPPPATKPKGSGSDYVETDGGVLIHRVVPDDNSCLFSSVALVFAQDIAKAPAMRQIVADGIKKDPITYDEAILGMEPSKYISKILQPMTWGGAIELAILARHFNTEIASVDVETGRIDHFAPHGAEEIAATGNGGMRCVLIYSGIHYDAATLAPIADAPAEWHQTMFPIAPSTTDDGDPIMVASKKLAGILRAKKAYTNTSTFDLKCEECSKGLVGEKGARAHAEETGHVRFGEY